MWQLASKKALRKTEDERRPSWAQRFKNIEPMNALRLRYNANKSIWVEDDIQIKIEVGFEMGFEMQFVILHSASALVGGRPSSSYDV